MIPRLLACLIATCLALPAHAQSRGVRAGAEAEAWAGVGILRVAGGGFCSAALIDPVTVLTAAHCVYRDGERRVAPPEAIRFNAGWREGISAAERGALRVIAHRDYDPQGAYDDANIAADLALVTLDEPIPEDAARAYAPLDKIRIGEPVTSVSFSGKRSDVASINDSCTAQRRDGDILILSCPSFPGMSGSPVFAQLNGKPRVVALISGTRVGQGGRNNGIALAVEAPLRRVRLDAEALAGMPSAGLPAWAAQSAAPVARAPVAARKRVTIGLSGLDTGGGASTRKVVRPPGAD